MDSSSRSENDEGQMAIIQEKKLQMDNGPLTKYGLLSKKNIWYIVCS